MESRGKPPWIYFHQLSLLRHRLRGRFQNPDHSEPGLSTGYRPEASLYAINKMLRLNLQRFSEIKLGSPHIARAITDKHRIEGLRTVSDSNAFVINLYFFAGFKIIVDDHLVTTAD